MSYTAIQRHIRQQRILHSATLELTYRCNLDCFYCYNDRDKAGVMLSLAQYERLLEDLARMQTLYLMLTGGEPMVHPHFFEIGRKARDLGFVTRIRTNGHSLNRRVAERLKTEVDPYMVEVSLHGATAEVHDRQTRVPGSFARLIDNLRAVGEVGIRRSLVSTPTAWNEHQLEDMVALSDELGLPLRFQGPVAPRDNGDTTPLAIQPSPAAWDKVRAIHAARPVPQPSSEGEETKHAAPPDPPATCSVGTTGVDIDPFGNVQACMHLTESAGNLHEQSIEAIWNHAPLFRRAREAAITAARRFQDRAPEQFGAPLFCIAVEECCNKNNRQIVDFDSCSAMNNGTVQR